MNLRGFLNARSSNGAIEVRRHSGGLKLSSSNGPIEIQATTPAPLEAHTSNGPIVVRMQAPLNASLNAHTSNGSIQSAFDVKQGVIEQTRVEGTIGEGGPLLKLSSSNGAIQLLRDGGLREKVTTTFTPGPLI